MPDHATSRRGIRPSAQAAPRSGRASTKALTSFQAKLDTRYALIGLRTEGAMLTEIVYLPRSAGPLAPSNALAERACAQIERYVADPDYRFDLPLKIGGTEFQRSVWQQIASIPRGRTRTYGELAQRLKSAPRAVGQACGNNRFPLVIPCHRVVAAHGLGGFAHHSAGFLLEVKRSLLLHEAETQLLVGA